MSLGFGAYRRERPRRQGRRLPRWALLGIWGIVASAGVGVFGSTFLQVYRLDREAARLEQRKRDLEAQNTQLRDEIKLLHTSAYIERLAREQLGLVKPGEIALLIVPTPGGPPARRPERSSASWLARVWKVLRDLFRR